MTIDLTELQEYLTMAQARLEILEVMAPDEMWEMAIQQVQNDLSEAEDMIAQTLALMEMEDDDFSDEES